MPNVAQTVYPTGHSIAPETLAPLPADWASKVYGLTIIADPDDPALPMLAWIEMQAGGSPVGGTGWSYDWDNNFGGAP